MSDALLKEYKEFCQKSNELQQQYRSLVGEIIPSKDMERRSLTSLRDEIAPLPESNPVFLSVGKTFLRTSVSDTKRMVDSSLSASERSVQVIAERKKFLEQALRDAEEKNRIYLSQLKPSGSVA